MTAAWSGRRVRRLVNACLFHKGTTCHLCGLPGADSADHEPPRSLLIERGVVDPDAIEYLFPAHLKCNERRKRRAITAALRHELRTRRLDDVGPLVDPSSLSPRFAKRADLLHSRPTSGKGSFRLSPGSPQKTEDPR